MHLFIQRVLALASLASLARSQGVITSAKGNTGTSYAMQVKIENLADANYINQAEIESNAVNACGRTFLGGDISEAGSTEELLETGNYTTVTKGSTITMVISQRFSNGSGPYTCDLDESSNALGAYGQTNLTVTQDSSQFGTGDLTLSIALPTNLTCIGASTGNMCTVRCVNSQSFGGCISVQQTDVVNNVNTVNNIATVEDKDAIAAQVTQNQKDLPYANKGLSGATSSNAAAKVVEAILAGDTAINGNENAASNSSSTASTKTSKTKTAKATTSTAANNAAAVVTTTVTKTVQAAAAAATDGTTTKTRTRRTRTTTSTSSTDTATVAAANAKATRVTGADSFNKRDGTDNSNGRTLRWAVRRSFEESDE